MKIAVGLSGGIDSTTTLLRLHEMGHEVVGVTMKALNHTEEYGKCCSIQDVHDAKQVCRDIGVRHYVLDVKEEFETQIIDYFVDEYLQGRTPNPCLFCNSKVKFKKLIEGAMTLGYEYFATGHYAILEQSKQGAVLRRAWDKTKDQSYFLSRVPINILSRCFFPLGKTYKKENIQYLKDRNSSVSQKRESHEICFVPGDNYAEFLKNRIPEPIQKGKILDEQGQEMGEHEGVPFYTIGQRRGLNLALGKPVYVRELDAQNNRITIGEKPYREQLVMSQVHWLTDWNLKLPLTVQVRVFHEGVKAWIEPIEKSTETTSSKNSSSSNLPKDTQSSKQPFLGERFLLRFETSVFSITPGQAAVGYDGDQVIFSGIIDS